MASMDARLMKFDGFGNPLPDAADSKFSKAEIESGEFVLLKDCYRNENSTDKIQKCVASVRACLLTGSKNCSSGGRAPILSNDDPKRLIGTKKIVRNLKDMDSEGLRESALETMPWSDYYWAIYKGVLGYRYADHHMASSYLWPDFHAYARETNKASTLIQSKNQDAIDRLSPSEKYDLLMGIDPDDESSLTSAMWKQGRSYYETSGKVETWMGVCHGWAPAAYMLPSPYNDISLQSPDGVKVTFYAQDIKALASYLWANSSVPNRFIGGRCNNRNPNVDEIGRVTDQECFDTNPGTWHISVVNMIGIKKESFVMDATYDYEVWNQPVQGYSYSYYNPQTGESQDALKKAVVKASKYEQDRFKKYRHEDAEYIVGVNMTVGYVVENNPSAYRQKDALRTVTYAYTLELDEDMNVIGGEWESNKHPDFLWTPDRPQALVHEDKFATGSWKTSEVVPSKWRELAKSAAARGSVLGKVVETLVEASKE